MRGVFCNIYTSNEAKPNLNYVINSNINKCEQNRCTIILYFGETSLEYTNMSYNKLIKCSCFTLYPRTEGNATFSTFYNNTSSNNICLAFDAEAISSLLKNCNCLYNSHESEINGLFYSHADLIIEYSTFLDNYSPIYYFDIYDGSFIKLIHCSISEDQISATGSFSTDSNSVSEDSFINELFHIHEKNCLNYIVKYKHATCAIKKDIKSNFLCSILCSIFSK